MSEPVRSGAGFHVIQVVERQAHALYLGRQQRDDLRPGLRTTIYRRRATVAFHITATQVVIDRILYGGRDLPALFEEGDDG